MFSSDAHIKILSASPAVARSLRGAAGPTGRPGVGSGVLTFVGEVENAHAAARRTMSSTLRV